MNTELETWLQHRFNAASAAAGHLSAAGLRVSPALAAWEEEFFLRGIHERLFNVNAQGQVESELVRYETEPGPPSRRYRVFSREPVRLLRENLLQLAIAGRLIFERGWLKSHVILEPGRDEHRTSADQFDLLVKSPAGDIFIWVEARRSAVELNKLIADLRACSRRGPHAHVDCGFPQNHPRHEFCVAHRPSCLWAVAPDEEICFAVKCNASAIELEPLPSLPPRSRFELDQKSG
ncbi:MAG TPA: hypothetical protein VH252_09105 [Chthoniobacterales bacterium]|nr:hypothetical protein [Chthoniobacterales bacterium]